MPKNSARSSKWATNNLRDWLVDYNLRNGKKCPDEIIETRSKDGDLYPPKTVYALLCGILCEMKIANPDSVPPLVPPSGAQYNNCTINVYSAPPNFGALPGPSHFQPPLPSHVPAMSILPASYSWLNYSDFDYYNQTHFQYL